MAELTPQQQRFVDEYLVDLNATQAAIRAGYSAKTARAQGSRLLTNVDIADAIQAKADARSERTGIHADTVLRELLRLGTVDIADAFDEQGRLKPVHKIPADVRRAISGIDVSAGEVMKLRFWDKRGSLELLGKHLKLFSDKVEHDVGDKLADLITASLSR